MKRMIILLLLCCNHLIASETTIKHYDDSKVDMNEINIVRLIYGIAQTESNFNSNAFNKIEDAKGLLQIRPIMIKEVNRIIGEEKYLDSDAWDKQKSIEIFKAVVFYHTGHFNQNLGLKTNKIKLACYIWNSGSTDTTSLKSEKYYNKVLNNINLIFNQK